MQDQTAVIPLSDEWWDEQSRLFGTTRIQTQFARIMVEQSGIRMFETARLAGAQGDHATLRTTGSRLNSNPKVRRLIEHARLVKDTGELQPVPPPKELLQMLGEISRKSHSEQIRITAMKTLLDYQDRFKETHLDPDDAALLGAIETLLGTEARKTAAYALGIQEDSGATEPKETAANQSSDFRPGAKTPTRPKRGNGQYPST